MPEDRGLYQKKEQLFTYNLKRKNYLFAIGINNYVHFPKLHNAVKDAQDLIDVLTTYYLFEKENVITLFDSMATKVNIVEKFEYLAGRLEKDDNLLIYFSGHGYQNPNSKIGYWIPVDAYRVADYLPNSSVRDYLLSINTHHTFLMADACFSGSLFSTIQKRLDTERYAEQVDKHKSRWALTSGRLEVVSDGQIGTNSPFASYLLKYLRQEGTSPFAVSDLVQYVKRATANNAEQTPIGGPLQAVGDNGGEFVFYPKASEELAWHHALAHIIAEYEAFLAKYPNGKFANQAKIKIQEIERLQREQVANQALNNAKRNQSISELMDFIDKYDDFPVLIEQAKAIIEEIKNTQSIYKEDVKKRLQELTDLLPFEPEMVFVQGGTFQMGCTSEQKGCYDNEKPVHSVTVSSFYIGKYEVTQKQWRDVMGSDPPELYNKNCDNCPVEGVSWEDVQEFLEKLNQKTGKKYRLPTEAEWEYAARGGNKSQGYLYAGSNQIDEVAWHERNSWSSKHGTQGTTHPVGTKKANELGIYDMSGNVWEWCEDWYASDFYEKTRGAENPVNKTTGINRVARGGGWGSHPGHCRVAYRRNYTPTLRISGLGFRLVHSL